MISAPFNLQTIIDYAPAKGFRILQGKVENRVSEEDSLNSVSVGEFFYIFDNYFRVTQADIVSAQARISAISAFLSAAALAFHANRREMLIGKIILQIY